MKISKIEIRNLFGITEKKLDGKSVELSGPKGAGKTSVLDSIRYALTNRSDRDFIIRQGADEGEILIETNTGLQIDRKKRTNKADAISVRDGNATYTRPAEFLSGIFTPLQLDPVAFTQMSRQEKNRTILNLIDFSWDLNWIKEKFGEIPQGVDYSQHILDVLAQIQAENGVYFQSRQAINRDIRNEMAFIADIGKGLPENYNAEIWRNYSLTDKIAELTKIQHQNRLIERAKSFRNDYESKKRSIEAKFDAEKLAHERSIGQDRERLLETIASAKAELSGLDERLSDKLKAVSSARDAELSKLEADMGTAAQYACGEIVDTSELSDEIATAERMKKYLNEYDRMKKLEREVEELRGKADALTEKIELARELPAQILSTAVIPIDGLTVENGIPLIHGLPISNLSDGELLELCVDVTVSKPGQLEIVLVDGAERLDSAARERLYAKCKEKGLQLIATRVSDSDELEVVEL